MQREFHLKLRLTIKPLQWNVSSFVLGSHYSRYGIYMQPTPTTVTRCDL